MESFKSKKKVDVSIICPNYNNGKYLSPFLQSVLQSTLLPKELIIVDDGSTDDSLSVLDIYKDVEFLKVIVFKQNKGLTAALNEALKIAKGKYIMRADPDDILLPNRIVSQYKFMEQNPDIDVVGSNVIYFSDIDGSEINKSNFPQTNKEISACYKKGEHGLQHPTAFVKGNVYKEYRYQKIFPAEDYEIFSRMVKDGRVFANIPEPLYMMRVHTGSSTSNIKLKHIKQTFEFRDQIFNTKTGKIKIWMYYKHIFHYRKSQLSKKTLLKYLHLSFAIAFYPKKLLRRFF